MWRNDPGYSVVKVLADITQCLGLCPCPGLLIAQHFLCFAKCDVRQQYLTGRKVRQVGGRKPCSVC